MRVIYRRGSPEARTRGGESEKKLGERKKLGEKVKKAGGESEKKLGERVKKAGGESEKSWGRK